MLSRGEQEFKEPEKARIYSQESIVVRLNNPGQQASSTAMKARPPASVSEESGPKVNARPSKEVVCSSPGKTTLVRATDLFVIRHFPVTGKGRIATSAAERRTNHGKRSRTTCRRCAYRERRAKTTTSTGTDTERDQAESTRGDSLVFAWEAGPVHKQAAASGVLAEPPVGKERAVYEKRAVVEPPVTRADGGGAVRAAPEKIAKTSGCRQPVEDAAFSHRDHMLTAVVGGGLMLGSLLIAILLLLVVSHRDKNAASVATSQEAKKTTPIKADWQPSSGKAYGQIHLSPNEETGQKRQQQHSKNRTNTELSTLSTTNQHEYGD
ncbi:uncharacterized protein LOC142765563 [Rhipicephalus microplus]|uniref:uncharacterized protein LOC142765563 n=1 Tax=Rhipicephalus microplus TaxID=6941 RepID=UPI003F6C94A8